ncbi:DUF3311 domain-containing protein [Brevibacillus fluminis]|uniref:DUF3311 domain-containing protein n=1 Tax=Brevibacillus fluminis TaxID=511487 RepID=A0A3M8DHY8_9BACL|nr:DUF3311 domain-containing protein [Brevibacillus fluminis]RNB87654.1 DUF3311 domain-containing protein [Brevibacillus fluminis]
MRYMGILAFLPFIGVLVGTPFANRVSPYVLGMPFILFWIVMWVVLTSFIMAIIFKFDPKNNEGEIK